MCPNFSNCIVVSEEDKSHLCNLCALKKVSVVPNGVDTNYFKPLSQDKKPNHLIWVGGMARHWGADAVNYFLDKIWPFIKSEIPEVTIDFIGKKPTKKLREKAAGDQSINILGFVNDIRPFVQRAAIFVAPIRSGSGTKIKVLNAMAQAKTVVGTTIAAEGIDAINNKNIIIAENAMDFSRKIVYFLRNKEKSDKIGQKARLLIEEKYSWEVIARQVENVYKKYE
jgi:glycosyltransferase involved in cell wall biosynthesis